MKKWPISTALAASIAGLAGPAVAAGEPPETIEFEQELSGCDLPVTAFVTGKSKTITLRHGGLIVTAPKQTVTVRNDETGETADFVITGVFFITTDEADNVILKARAKSSTSVPHCPRTGTSLSGLQPLRWR